MGTYLNPWFYAAVGILYCGLQWQPPKLRRTTWFGILNIAALGALIGVRFALVAAFAAALWACLHALSNLRDGPARRVLEVSIYAAATLAFLFHKLASDWIAVPATGVPSEAARQLARFLEVVAFSYVYLRALDAIRAVAGGARLLDPAALSGYLAPFFMMPAGPVNVYADHVRMDTEELQPPSWDGFVACADTITSGLFLKFVVAETWRLYFIGLQPSWPTGTFQDAATIFIYVYFDFFGYSLVALGVGRLLGISTPINFKAPFVSGSVTEFWTRWHISLGDFIRRDLFIPLQVAMVRRFGRPWAYATNMLALVVCFVFVGLWHRFTLTFALWGLAVGAIVALEKVARDRWTRTALSREPAMKLLLTVLGPIYVFAIIVGTLRVAMPELMGQAR